MPPLRLLSCPPIKGVLVKSFAPPLNELDQASKAINAMKNASSIDESEEHWKTYLHRLERVWSKSESFYGLSPKWPNWKGRFTELRKTDPLLSYLRNARGAEEHTISEIVSRTPGNITLTAGPTGSVHIRRLVIGNGSFMIDADGPVNTAFNPEKLKLEPITNRGRLYEVPRFHLGKPIPPTDIYAIAAAGLRFYKDFLAEADKYFGINPRAPVNNG